MALSRRLPPEAAGRLIPAAALLVFLHLTVASAIGVNYGTVGDNLPPPAQVANFIKTQTIIDRVKIFDTNPDIIRAFANTGIAMTITAGNGDITPLTQIAFAKQWVATNVAPYYPKTNIIRVLVGSEVLHWGDASMINNLVSAMRTLRTALDQAGYTAIQVSTAHSLGIIENADIPSMCRFRAMYEHVLRPLLQFHRETKSPFMVNPYPYFGFSPEKANYCLFKPNRGVYDRATRKLYTNMFDSLMDAVHIAMMVYGYRDVSIAVGETGWASQGDAGLAPGMDNAIAYNGALLKHVQSKIGTPLMPNRRFETYIFSLFNENLKPGPLAEKNFGLFWPNFSPVYQIGILRNEQQTGALRPTTPVPSQPGGQHKGKQYCIPKQGVSDQALQSNINYICTQGIDCKPIQAGGKCFQPNNLRSHASFLMNSYYQTKGRVPYNCDFAGTGMVTSANPSYGTCQYL